MTATTHVGRAFRPDRSILIGLGWRIVVVLAGAVAVALEAPAVIRAPLTAAAAVLVVLWYVQRVRRRGAMDTWLLAIGTIVAVLVLLGLLLDSTPVGLSALGWSIAVGTVELALLVVLAFVRPPIQAATTSRRPSPAALGWSAAVLLVLGGAVVWSAVSFEQTHVLPLAIEAEPHGSTFTVTVTSGSDEGPFRLDLVTDDGRTTISRGVRVGPGHDASTTITLPKGARGLVQLVPEGAAGPVRELILDRTTNAGTQ